MHPSVIPSINDLGSLIAFLVGNPYLFISSITVMTTGLILGAVAVNVLPYRAPILRRFAPTLALILAYFGVGSIVLSIEILLRRHYAIPYETEVQFVSGIGHLAEALIGIAVLFPHLRGHTRAEWLWAHNASLAYWTFQITVLAPPWFSFADQRPLVTTAALAMLAIAAAMNVRLWRGVRASVRDRGEVAHHPDDHHEPEDRHRRPGPATFS